MQEQASASVGVYPFRRDTAPRAVWPAGLSLTTICQDCPDVELCHERRSCQFDGNALAATIRRAPLTLAGLKGLIESIATKAGELSGPQGVIDSLDAAAEGIEDEPPFDYEQHSRDQAYLFREMCDADARMGAES